MRSILNVVADFSKQLAGAVSIGDTTALLNSGTDSDGIQLQENRIYGFTIDSGSKKEYIIALLTNGVELSQIVSVSRQGQASSGFAKPHAVGSTIQITDWAALSRITQTLNGDIDLNAGVPLKYDDNPAQTNPLALATVQFVLDTASGSTVIAFNPQTIDGQATDVDSGDWVYFDEATGLWEKTDASDPETSVDVKIGKSRGSVDSVSPDGIPGGIFVSGTETTGTYTAGQKYYLSDTAGELSTTPGTNNVLVGIGDENGDLMFLHTYISQLPSDKFINESQISDPQSDDEGKVVKLESDGKISNDFIRSNDSIIEDFDDDGTWTKHKNAKWVLVRLVGCGGNGGGGLGSGAGGGEVVEMMFRASELTDTVAINVGQVGDAQNTTFGSYLTARAGETEQCPVFGYGAGLVPDGSNSPGGVFGGGGLGGSASGKGGFGSSASRLFGAGGGGARFSTGGAGGAGLNLGWITLGGGGNGGTNSTNGTNGGIGAGGGGKSGQGGRGHAQIITFI
jgi:hypothetical protein